MPEYFPNGPSHLVASLLFSGGTIPFALTRMVDSNDRLALVWDPYGPAPVESWSVDGTTGAFTFSGGVMLNPMTTPGDMVIGGASGSPLRLPVGIDGWALQALNGAPAWGPLADTRAAEWEWRTTHSTPAPDGKVSVDSQAAPTSLLIAARTNDGLDSTLVLTGIRTGDRIYIQDKFDSTRYLNLDVTADAVFIGNTCSVAVTPHGEQGVAIANTRRVRVVATFFGGATGISGGGMINPMTTAGDVIVGETNGAPARLGVGTNGDVLTLVAGSPQWQAAALLGLLHLEGVGTLGTRDGLNPVTFRVYNTFTDASNGEWVQLAWSGNTATLTPAANGTGTLRTLRVVHGPPVVISYSASMTPNAALGNHHVITVTNGTPFAINAPLNPAVGQELTVMLRNTTGGVLGAVTWNAVFKLGLWLQPTAGNSRSITFLYDGTNWVEITRTLLNVPN